MVSEQLKNKLKLKSIFCVVVAGILWGIISIFIKTLHSVGFTLVQILMIRASISAIMLFFYLLIQDKTLLFFKLKDIWMFIGTGIISLSFFSLCYFSTILSAGALVAVTLLYTSPIFVLLLSAAFFREKISVLKMIALISTFTGCILTAGLMPSKSGVSVSPAAFIVGLCSGLGYALYSIFSRYALKKYRTMTIIFYTFLFSAISLIPFCNIGALVRTVHDSAIAGYSGISISATLLGIALFCTVLPYILYTHGLKGLETGKAAIFVTIEPLVGTLTGIFMYHELCNPIKLAGIAMILVSIVLCGIPDRQTET